MLSVIIKIDPTVLTEILPPDRVYREGLTSIMISQHPSLLAAHLASLAIRSLLLWSLPLAAAILRIGFCLATLWSRGTGRCIPFTTGHGERRLKDRARQRARSVIVNQVVDGRRRTCIYIHTSSLLKALSSTSTTIVQRNKENSLPHYFLVR